MCVVVLFVLGVFVASSLIAIPMTGSCVRALFVGLMIGAIFWGTYAVVVWKESNENKNTHARSSNVADNGDTRLGG